MAERIPPTSSWNLPPTARQTLAITRLCQQLGITEYLEDKPSNRREARNLIMALRERRKQNEGNQE